MARILIVDDEETVLKSIRLLLRSEGHEVVATKNPEEALRLAKEESFDLLMTDIRMAPLDGMELIRILHEVKPGLPVIIISAYSSAATTVQGIELGAVAYIPKPFRVEDVLLAVNKALAGK